MDNPSKVIKFGKDRGFLLDQIARNFRDDNFLSCVKNLLELRYLEGESETTTNRMLAENYCALLNFELSNFFCFKQLKLMVTSGDPSLIDYGIYSLLAQNYFNMGRIDLGKYYLNLAKDKESDKMKLLSQLINFAEDEGMGAPNDNEIKANEYMSEGNFEKTVEALSDDCDLKKDSNRATMSIAQLFAGDGEGALETIKSNGTDSIGDLTTLLLIYKNLNKTVEFEAVKRKLLSMDYMFLEDKFRVGLGFAFVGDDKTAYDMMKDLIDTKKAEAELQFLYALVCYNVGKYNEARELLIDLSTLNYISAFMYEYYAKVCAEHKMEKVICASALPASEYDKINAKIKDLATFDNDALYADFCKNTKFYYFVVTSDMTKFDQRLLLRLCGYSGTKVNDFFDFVLFSPRVQKSFKYQVLCEKMEFERDLMFVRGGFMKRLLVPDMEVLKRKDKKVYKAFSLAMKYIFTQDFKELDLNIILDRVNKLKFTENTTAELLAVFINFHLFNNGNRVILKTLCRLYNVPVDDFYELVSNI